MTPGAPAAAARRREGAALAALALGYLSLATAYATRTPAWQAPDEPAHFNYVAAAANDPLNPPRIAPGDWDAARLEALKAQRFPTDASVEGIAYEDHQPPAYYYLASLAYRLASGAPRDRLHAVRLVGVALGLVTVLATWAALRGAFPSDPVLAWAGAGFVAFLPMHLAVTATANNDALANAVGAVVLALALARLSGRVGPRAFTWAGGLLAGLALVTKLTVAPAALLLATAEAARGRLAGEAMRTAARRILGLSALAALVAAPWWLRNAAVYGGVDIYGLAAHDAVVVGQPRTAEWIAAHGPAAYAIRALTFTFESFWGVFGWLGVFLDPRIYAALALASAGAAVGVALWAAGARRRSEGRVERAAAGLLGLAALVAVAELAWYNRSFVQHQGRYLFAALPAWGAFAALGVREIGRRLGAPLGERAARRLGAAALGAAVAGLAGLAWLALTRYVVPGLT